MTGPIAGAGTPVTAPTVGVDKALENAGKAKGVDEAGRDATQVVKDLARAGVVPNSTTASGHAASGSPGSEAEKVPAKGEHAEVKPDAVGKGSPLLGAQLQAATFTTNGSIPQGTVPSPTGPVPAALLGDKDSADRAMRIARAGAISTATSGKNSRFRLTDEAAARLSPAQLRAVAHDRGYAGVEGGRAGVVAKFLAAQRDDQSLTEPEGTQTGSIASVPQSQTIAPTNTDRGAPGDSAAAGTPTGTPTPAGTLSNTDGSPANTMAKPTGGTK